MHGIEDLRGIYPTKSKSIDDLVRFIENRIDARNPNFSLFLGAGCSITSGVRSAETLINVWKRELDKDKLNEIPRTINVYGHLFEQKYDLPKQRRMFVENEIKDKQPGLGYAYLVKLIESAYFKTIFTTNFDDLVNQAFYNYGTIMRPIVCAHDSSINSIAVTSERPKIIKLHGDYLFDDIKSTIRETESLEENMRNKFFEFAKDYGLIVIGYGGQDRSIMDVLTHMLKREDYFSNGVYWCIRKGSEVSDELFQLVGKDRVFFVEIDGFDELMATLNARLNAKRLPLETKVNNSAKDILGEINKYKETFKNCSFIMKDLKECEGQLRLNTMMTGQNVTEIISSREGSIPKKFEESCYTAEVKEKIALNKFEDAIQTAKKYLENSPEHIDTITDLHYMLSYCYRKTDNYPQALAALESLVEHLDAKKIGNTSLPLNKLAELNADQGQYEEALQKIERSLKVDPYYSETYELKADLISTVIKNTDFTHAYINADVVENYSKSIELSSTLSNSAYLRLCNFYIENNNYKEAEKVFEKYSALSPCNTKVVSFKAKLLLDQEKSFEDCMSYFDEVNKQNKLYSRYKEYDYTLATILKRHGKLNELVSLIEKINNNYPREQRADSLKSDILLDNFRDVDAAISVLSSSVEESDNYAISSSSAQSYKEQLLHLYLYADNFTQAHKTLEALESEYAETDDKKRYYKLKMHLAASESNLEELNELIKNYPFRKNADFYIQASFGLLRLNQNQEAASLVRPFLDQTSFSDPAVVINYELASKRTNKMNNKRVAKIAEDMTVGKIARHAAKALLGETLTVKQFLETEIKSDYSNWFHFREFPVFSEIDFNDYKLPKIEFRHHNSSEALQLVAKSA